MYSNKVYPISELTNISPKAAEEVHRLFPNLITHFKIGFVNSDSILLLCNSNKMSGYLDVSIIQLEGAKRLNHEL